MKTKLSSLIFLFFILIVTNSSAQVNVNVNINALPDWAPARYVPETRYYYIPELQVYYDIPSKMYIYPHKKGWVRNKKLPKHYAKYNLNTCHKVSLYDIGPNPYAHYDMHRKKYPQNYRRGTAQPTRHDFNNNKGKHPNHGDAFDRGRDPKKDHKRESAKQRSNNFDRKKDNDNRR
jgi:hypothetical protein